MEPLTETPCSDVYGWIQKRSTSLASHLTSRGLNLPDPDCLRNCVRSAGPSSPTLLLDEASAPAPEVDTQKMTASFIISTTSKDRMGDIVLPQGCLRFLPKTYSKNPRVFFSHKSREMPIGSARHPDGTLALEVQPDSYIKSTCYFHCETPESSLVFRMVARKELQASSIGFLPVKAAILTSSKEPERPETNEHGEDLIYFEDGSSWFPSLRFHEWDLTEWSIVPIPANSDCIAQHLSRGKIEDEPLTDLFRKSLEPWASPRKIWSPGALLLPLPETKEVDEILTAGEAITVEKLEGSPEISPVVTLDMTQDPPGIQTQVEKETPTPEVQDPVQEKMDDLIPPPVQPSEPEDPQKGWPHGAKTLSRALASMGAHTCMIGECEPELDNPKVKSHISRHKARIEKLVHKMKVLANKVYPDLFEDPGPAPKSLSPASTSTKSSLSFDDLFPPASEPSGPAPAPVPELPWDEILSKLNTISSSQEAASESLFEITGKRI